MKGKKRALIIVDPENDFCPPGGALPVPCGDEVVPVVNSLEDSFNVVVITQDWHPKNHCSFKKQGGPHPKHCVEHTWGAMLHSDLKVPDGSIFIRKGMDPNKEAYSGFMGDPNLAKILREQGVREVYVCGLATDYCVKATALDAKEAGFDTFVIVDACRGVNKQDSDRAVRKMRRAKIKIVNSWEVK